MADIGNINGYRSVYMAFGAFRYGMGEHTVNATGNKKTQALDGGNEGALSFMSIMNNASERIAGLDEAGNRADDAGESFDLAAVDTDKSIDMDELGAGKSIGMDEENEGISTRTYKNAAELGGLGQGSFLSYTRIITAKIPKDISEAMKIGSSGSPFDFSGDSQELKITINVSGGSRIYTASGTDKDGNKFTKEIDPYNVDPTNADYADFATLCAYIRDTEGMADNAMQAVRDAAPTDITEKGNYLYKVGFYAETNGNLSGAKKLFEQMESFFQRLMGIGKLDVTGNADGTESVNRAGIVNVKSDDPNAISISSGISDMGNASDSSKKNGASEGAFYSRLLDELHEMIQQMMQKILNEILGIDDEGSSEEAEAADTGVNAINPGTDSQKFDELNKPEANASTPESIYEIPAEKANDLVPNMNTDNNLKEENSVEKYLDMSGAVTL
ncbi:hypothetical protein [Butyrivibrio sp. LC3010]|uniref:hypothetical protein n=1 Tax=Butyrivibrio sp. LC3010 TaxID=1280680 RepID=UPI0012DD1083|nr:hypothetical protein [Butyrivibrio sp. LC3010]